MSDSDIKSNFAELATELTIAWLSNSNTRASAAEVPEFLSAMYAAVSSLENGGTSASTEIEAQPAPAAVTVRKSLASKDFILSLLDGKPYKTLRRHLSRHGLTPEQYRERFGLKPDYPMVSETYSTARREMAKKIGLGRKPGMMRPAASKKPGRKPAAD